MSSQAWIAPPSPPPSSSNVWCAISPDDGSLSYGDVDGITTFFLPVVSLPGSAKPRRLLAPQDVSTPDEPYFNIYDTSSSELVFISGSPFLDMSAYEDVSRLSFNAAGDVVFCGSKNVGMGGDREWSLFKLSDGVWTISDPFYTSTYRPAALGVAYDFSCIATRHGDMLLGSGTGLSAVDLTTPVVHKLDYSTMSVSDAWDPATSDDGPGVAGACTEVCQVSSFVGCVIFTPTATDWTKHGIYTFGLLGNTLSGPIQPFGNPSTAANRVLTMSVDQDGYLWAMSLNGRIVRFTTVSDSFVVDGPWSTGALGLVGGPSFAPVDAMASNWDTPSYGVVEAAFVADVGSFVLDDASYGQLDEDILGDELGAEWTDLTSYVRDIDGLTIERGATRQAGPLVRYEVGRVSFTLDNLSGQLDPSNLYAPYPYVTSGQHNMKPGLPVRVRGVGSDGVIDPLYLGYVDSVLPTVSKSGLLSQVKVTASDATRPLSEADLPEQPAAGAGDSPGARINRLLDNINWPQSKRSIDLVATTTLQATTMAQPAWTEILLASDSAGGAVWIDAIGRVVYRAPGNEPSEPSLSISWAGDGDVKPYDFQPSYDSDQLYNTFKLARAGGTQQSYGDETSQWRFGYRTYSRNDLLSENDDQLAELAARWLSRFAVLAYRIDSVSVKLTPANSQEVWHKVLQRDIGDMVNVKVPLATTGMSFEYLGYVRGIFTTIAWDSWSVTFVLQQAYQKIGTFVLDESSLDVGTLVSS